MLPETVEKGIFSNFPENRWEALNQYFTLLGFSKSELSALVKLLNSADTGFLSYKIGDVYIEFCLTSGEIITEGEPDILCLKLRKSKGKTDFIAEYTFEISELKTHLT